MAPASSAQFTARPRLYRPTWLAAASRHCARAVDFHEQGGPYDRSIYQAGTAAHAVLQAIGTAVRANGGEISTEHMQAVADATAGALIEFGRVEEGVQEPPLSPDAVFEGRDLAMAFALVNPLSPSADYEIGLAVDADWKPVAFDAPTARLRCILDLRDRATASDEESAYDVLAVEDYKSAWPTDESELETVQRKAQGLVALAHAETLPDVLRLRVHNLRTGKTFTRDLFLGFDETKAELEQWRADVTRLMDVLDRQAARGMRPASPGAGCMGCPFLFACDEAQDYIENTRIPGTPRRRAEMYAVAVANIGRLRDTLKLDTEEAPIEINNGLVGTLPNPQRVLAPNGYALLADEWSLATGIVSDETEAALRSFAKALKLGASNVDAALKVLFPSKADEAERERIAREVLTTKVKRDFGVYAKPREEEQDAAA